MFETNPIGTTRFKPVKNIVYQVGRQCYKHKPTRVAYDIASFVIDHAVGLPFVPNFHYGEIRQALLRTATTKNEKLIEVLPWDLAPDPWVPQIGITEAQKMKLAQHLFNDGMNRDYAMMMFLVMPSAAVLAVYKFAMGKTEIGLLTKIGVGFAAVTGGLALATSIMYLASTSLTHKNLAIDYLKNREGLGSD